MPTSEFSRPVVRVRSQLPFPKSDVLCSLRRRIVFGRVSTTVILTMLAPAAGPPPKLNGELWSTGFTPKKSTYRSAVLRHVAQ